MTDDDRKGLGQRISDGLLPESIVKILYKPIIPGTVFNGYSIVHFLVGAISALAGIENFLTAFLIHLGWEIFQFAVGDNRFEKEDLLYDIPLDTAMFLFGWYIAKNMSILGSGKKTD